MGHSNLLFAEPSFLEGMGRALDVGGTLTEFNSSLTVEQADALAMWADWRTVGADIKAAMAAHAAQHAKTPSREQEK